MARGLVRGLSEVVEGSMKAGVFQRRGLGSFRESQRFIATEIFKGIPEVDERL